MQQSETDTKRSPGGFELHISVIYALAIVAGFLFGIATTFAIWSIER